MTLRGTELGYADDFAVRRLLRELYQLRKLRGHANVVSISNLRVKTRREFDPALNCHVKSH
eukprot:2391698-Rhodomonas_salina.1